MDLPIKGLRSYTFEDLKVLDPSKTNMCYYSIWVDESKTTFFPIGDTASDTLQLITSIRSGKIPKAIDSLQGKPIFMKVAPQNSMVEGNSLLFEILIYKYLTLLREANILNCIPRYLMDFSCVFKSQDYQLSDISSSVGGYQTSLNRRSKGEFRGDAHHILVTEQLSEPSFRTLEYRLMTPEFLKDLKGYEPKVAGGEPKVAGGEPKDDSEMQSILFQLEYITNQLHKCGIRHNDLHDSNVYIEDLGSERSLIFYDNILGKMVRSEIITRYKVYVIDFDRAAVINSLEEVNNRMVSQKRLGLDLKVKNLCNQVGSCDYPMETFDINTILSDIYAHLNKNMTKFPSFTVYLENKYPNKDYPNYFMRRKFDKNFSGRLCRNSLNCDDPDWDPTEYEGPDSAYITSHEVIAKSYDVIFPDIDHQIVRDHSLLEHDLQAFPKEDVSVSIEIHNPFPEGYSKVIGDLYKQTLQLVKNVDIAPEDKVIIRKVPELLIFKKDVNLLLDLINSSSNKIRAIMNFIDYLKLNVVYTYKIEGFRNLVYKKIREFSLLTEDFPKNYLDESLVKLGF